MLTKIKFQLLPLFLLFFISQINNCQDKNIDFNESIDFFIIPNKVHEASGLIFYNGLLWSFNDSGGKPVLYALSNKNGEIKSEIKLKKGKNYDWEDITHDDQYIYIGDFGNNLGNRKNLRIFKIDKKNIQTSKTSKIEYETIYFSFEDQTSFKPSFGQTAYDCESIIALNDQLIVFTKDWKNQKSAIYPISKKTGNYRIKKIKSIDIKGLVTGAEYISENRIILCGRNQVAPFIAIIDIQNYSIIKSINFPLLKGYQIEGITVDNEFLYLSSEKTFYPPRIFKIELNKIINF
ncbi:hypothetical protein ACFLTE_00590 [Bacteroidota bacterium]